MLIPNGSFSLITFILKSFKSIKTHILLKKLDFSKNEKRWFFLEEIISKRNIDIFISNILVHIWWDNDWGDRSPSPQSSKEFLVNFNEFESELDDRSYIKKISKRLTCKKIRRRSFRGPFHGLDFYFK